MKIFQKAIKISLEEDKNSEFKIRSCERGMEAIPYILYRNSAFSIQADRKIEDICVSFSGLKSQEAFNRSVFASARISTFALLDDRRKTAMQNLFSKDCRVWKAGKQVIIRSAVDFSSENRDKIYFVVLDTNESHLCIPFTLYNENGECAEYNKLTNVAEWHRDFNPCSLCSEDEATQNEKEAKKAEKTEKTEKTDKPKAKRLSKPRSLEESINWDSFFYTNQESYSKDFNITIWNPFGSSDKALISMMTADKFHLVLHFANRLDAVFQRLADFSKAEETYKEAVKDAEKAFKEAQSEMMKKAAEAMGKGEIFDMNAAFQTAFTVKTTALKAAETALSEAKACQELTAEQSTKKNGAITAFQSLLEELISHSPENMKAAGVFCVPVRNLCSIAETAAKKML